MVKEAYCYICRKLIYVKRRRAKNYCSPACKQKSYRERREDEKRHSEFIERGE